MNIEDLHCIRNISSWDSGGGVELDIVELEDGKILAISEEVIILYESFEDLQGGDISRERPTIIR